MIRSDGKSFIFYEQQQPLLSLIENEWFPVAANHFIQQFFVNTLSSTQNILSNTLATI